MLPKITSIFSAKNYSIHERIKLANNLEQNNILIINHSLSALLSLKPLSTENEISQNIQTFLIHSKKNIEFMQVPSHTYIVGNIVVLLIRKYTVVGMYSEEHIEFI